MSTPDVPRGAPQAILAEKHHRDDPNQYRIPDGRDLKDIRATLGLTQSEVADEVGLTVAAISEIEREVNQPRLATLRAMLAVYQEEWSP